MSNILILVNADLTEEQNLRIHSALPDTQLEQIPSQLRKAAFRDQRGVEEAWRDYLQRADVLFTDLNLPDGLAKYAPKLKMIHIASAGVETLLDLDLIKDTSIPVTVSVGGANSTATAEFALALMLDLAKGLSILQTHQQERRWHEGYEPLLIAGKTLGLIGLGHINRHVAKLAKAMDMRVIACHRTGTRMEVADNVDEIVPQNELAKLLVSSDFVVIAAPLTPATRGLIGERELRMMKKTSYLINVGRGEIVVGSALIRGLQEGWIAGAGLDVFDQEPLPSEHPLWSLPNVVISPHIGGMSESFMNDVVDMLCHNLKRLVSEEPLLNLMDRGRGY